MNKLLSLGILTLLVTGCSNNNTLTQVHDASPTPGTFKSAAAIELESLKTVSPHKGEHNTQPKRLKSARPVLVLESLKPAPVNAKRAAPVLARTKTTAPQNSNKSRKAVTRNYDPTPRVVGVSSNVRNKVIAAGKTLLGIPYRYGGTSRRTGFDCSGLMQYIFRQNGYNLPRTSGNQYAGLFPVKNPQPGDLVFFRHGRSRIGHVGLYLGNQKMLHAPSTGKRIAIVSINTPYWKKRYAGARSVITGFRTAAR